MKWINGFVLPVVLACLPVQGIARPNIVFVMADDLGYADLGCYGQRAFSTPNLDLMAAEGVRFIQAYSGSTVCAPARSTLMTGRHAGRTSVRSNTGGVPLLEADVTLAEVLSHAGYSVGGFGKWGLGDLDTPGAPEKQGFDRFYGYYHQVHAHDHYPDFLIDTGKKVRLPGNAGFVEKHPDTIGLPAMNGDQPAVFAHARIKQAMFEWIRANRSGPFFCYAAWTLPHGRFQIPADDPAWQAVKDEPWSDAAKGHAAFTIRLDRDMGELFALLRDLGIERDTVVFFCSDNGADARYEEELNSCGPLRGSKRALYEGGLRVPLIVRWPGMIAPAQTCILPVYFPDMLPTLAQLAGVGSRLPEDLDGLSFAPTLLGQPGLQMVHDNLYWEFTPVQWDAGGTWDPDNTAQAARVGAWKAVRPQPDGEIELYDLRRDPGETNNLAAAHKGMVDDMARLFRTARTEPRAQQEPDGADGRPYR